MGGDSDEVNPDDGPDRFGSLCLPPAKRSCQLTFICFLLWNTHHNEWNIWYYNSEVKIVSLTVQLQSLNFIWLVNNRQQNNMDAAMQQYCVQAGIQNYWSDHARPCDHWSFCMIPVYAQFHFRLYFVLFHDKREGSLLNVTAHSSSAAGMWKTVADLHEHTRGL